MKRLRRAAAPTLAVAIAMASLPGMALAEPARTLQSGHFEDRLMIAADPETGLVSGYFRDGACRLFFRGPFSPVTLSYRPEWGEAYEVASWEPAHPDAEFTTTIYSRARGGFSDQLSLSLGSDANRLARACHPHVSLDRADHVGNSLIGVRVIGRNRPRLYDVIVEAGQTRIVPKKSPPLRRGTGVWVAKTYGAAWSPAGYVQINWYYPPGTPQGGYVRERDLYPLPPEEPAP